MNRTLRPLVLVTAVATAVLVGCKVQLYGDWGELELRVPYVSAGTDIRYCAVASVLMWRKYDGAAPDMNLSTLGQAMGCVYGSGCEFDDILWGIKVYTNSGRDAVLDCPGCFDHEGVATDRPRYFSRQITSLDNGRPVVAITDGSSHAVVVVAGDFSTAADGLKSWDRVFVHDPAVGAHVRYTAGSWYIENSYQFLSFAAMQGSVWNFNQYGEIHIRGLSDSWRGSDWPPAL